MDISSRKKTLLHICNYATPYKGSFIAALESLERSMNVENVYMFPHRAKETGAEKWINQLNSHGVVAYVQLKGFFSTLILLRKIIKNHHVDCVLTHFLDRRIDLILFFIYKGCHVIRFFCSYVILSRIKHYVACCIWRGNVLVGISKPLAENLRLNYRGFTCRTIENAIDFERLDKLGNFRREGRDNEIGLLCMGYDMNVKGTDLAIQAASRMREKGLNIQLSIVAICEKQKEAIEEYMNSMGIVSGWIRILPPTQNMAEYYNNADIFLSPSRSEAFGNAVVEAAYSGNAVVASKVGGQAALEIEGAYWFRNCDLDDFCSQLDNAIVEYRLPSRVMQREKAANHVREKYSLSKWCDAVIHTVNEAVCQ